MTASTSIYNHIYHVETQASSPWGKVPLDPDVLTQGPSGQLFGWTQDGADAGTMWMRFLRS